MMAQTISACGARGVLPYGFTNHSMAAQVAN
eukprot:CAMPEP_0119534286 /NCGR_PEP_ID=MMETSP1344-20130328/47551_1 /TAXON_ID=236787 /ORGANISM="Florenciella parvula, Strain CCMP2471" /LENGTH=30 /DNA_ID= /DNA_START= /DNA_END= /DNA_ORIENTATION=